MKTLYLVGLGATVLASTESGVAYAYTFNFDLQYCPNRNYGEGLSKVLKVESSGWDSVPLASSAPGTFPNLPSGCRCVNEAETSEACTAFVCHETCNLNVGVCDQYCCSDPDCTAEEVERFKNTGTCLPDGQTNQVKFCTDTSTLDKVNEKFNMYVDQDDEPLSGFFCVSVDNSAFEGEFYEPQTKHINNVALLNDRTVQSEYVFEGEKQVDGSSEHFYLTGASIKAALESQDGSLKAAFGGMLTLPTRGVNGECSKDNYVKFGQDVQTNKCLRFISDLEQECGNPYGFLSTSPLGNLRVAQTPMSLVASSSGWLTPSLGTVYALDLSTGQVETTGITSSPTTSPTSMPSSNPTVSPTGSPTVETSSPSSSPTSAQATPQGGRRALFSMPNPTAFNSTTNTCDNALVGVLYKISHNAVGEITEVVVEPTVASIPSNGSLFQSYQVEFINVDSNPVNVTEVGPQRIVSGNPGYITGLPVQAGSTVTDNTTGTKNAVDLLVDGLQMLAPAGAGGECFVAGTSPWYESIMTAQAGQTSVLFGVNQVSSCAVRLTYYEFTNMTNWCKDFRDAPLLQLDADVVGIYGNANPYYSWDWATLFRQTEELLQTQPDPSPGALTCRNLIDQVSIEVLWTKSGETANPQAQILSARTVLKQSDWSWGQSLDPGASQDFYISHSVRFVEHKLEEEDTFPYMLRTPPIIPALPSDIFYPFDIAPSSASQSRPTVFAVLSLCLALLYAFRL